MVVVGDGCSKYTNTSSGQSECWPEDVKLVLLNLHTMFLEWKC